jgi:DNA-binding NarL/FixJ family response regulator
MNDEASDMKPISVLLVDNNRNFLRIATHFLEVQDNVSIVGAVCRDEEALAQSQDLRPDVILIDVSPHNGHGLDTISRLRAALPRAGIIALALVDTDGYWRAALEAGADDFVPKFAMSTNLLPAIQRVTQANTSHGERAPSE